MTVGVPGAGIAGLFYLAGALLAPLREVARAATGDPRPRQWRLVWRQFAIATSILGGMAATAWLIGIVGESPAAATVVGAAHIGREYPVLLARNPAALSVTTLAGVLVAVELLRLIVLNGARARRVAVLACVLSGLTAEAGGQTAEQAPVVELGGVA